MVEEYNSLLAVDGWEIYPVKEISGKPVYGFRRLIDSSSHHLDKAAQVAQRLSGSYLAQQVRRMQDAAEKDPELAIGTAKEFLETLCKTILAECGVEISKNEDLPGLVRMTIKILSIVPPGLADPSQPQKTITVLLNNLGSIANQLAEIRNQFGTGHGKQIQHIGLSRRHAMLAVGAATTLAIFLYECHEAGGVAKTVGP